MEVAFGSKRMQKLCSSEAEMRGKLGPECAEKLMRRLAEFKAATTLQDLRALPGPRCHELTGDLKGLLSVDLKHPQRLLFRPTPPPPLLPAGGLDWGMVKGVIVERIEDTH
jgi:proteic killer suppression protein